MKLRNKKTGEVIDAGCRTTLNGGFWITRNGGRKPIYMNSYRTLAELNAEWEDYEPKEPLIDFYDDRKLVRHWAEVHNIKEVWVHGIGDGKEVVEIYDVENGLMRMTLYRPEKMAIDKTYTIAELCGEEEG